MIKSAIQEEIEATVLSPYHFDNSPLLRIFSSPTHLSSPWKNKLAARQFLRMTKRGSGTTCLRARQKSQRLGVPGSIDIDLRGTPPDLPKEPV
jgi:hypothetical protein